MNEMKIDGRWTVKGVMEELGISESTVWRWAREGGLTPIYRRARVTFSAREVRKIKNIMEDDSGK